MFEFTAQQTAFLNDPSPLRIMGGSAIGTGKTFVGYYEALRLSREIPGNYGVIFCNDPKQEQNEFMIMMDLPRGEVTLETFSDMYEIFIKHPDPDKKWSTIWDVDGCYFCCDRKHGDADSDINGVQGSV